MDSARFRADPANFRQNYFPVDPAERSADSARIRADPRRVRRELAEGFTRKMSADKNLSYTSAPRGRLGLGLGFRLGLWLRLGLGLR